MLLHCSKNISVLSYPIKESSIITPSSLIIMMYTVLHVDSAHADNLIRLHNYQVATCFTKTTHKIW